MSHVLIKITGGGEGHVNVQMSLNGSVMLRFFCKNGNFLEAFVD